MSESRFAMPHSRGKCNCSNLWSQLIVFNHRYMKKCNFLSYSALAGENWSSCLLKVWCIRFRDSRSLIPLPLMVMGFTILFALQRGAFFGPSVREELWTRSPRGAQVDFGPVPYQSHNLSVCTLDGKLKNNSFPLKTYRFFYQLVK